MTTVNSVRQNHCPNVFWNLWLRALCFNRKIQLLFPLNLLELIFLKFILVIIFILLNSFFLSDIPTNLLVNTPQHICTNLYMAHIRHTKEMPLQTYFVAFDWYSHHCSQNFDCWNSRQFGCQDFQKGNKSL